MKKRRIVTVFIFVSFYIGMFWIYPCIIPIFEHWWINVLVMHSGVAGLGGIFALAKWSLS